MKVSLNWIRDYVQLPADADLKKLAYDLTMSTVEVEDTIELAKQFDHMVVGVINTIEQHPNADKLRVCMTDIGGRVESIVCGGSNLREGMKVAVALPGSVCRWHGEGEPVEIKKSKLRGVDSYGMICGAVEIGLADLFPTDVYKRQVPSPFPGTPPAAPSPLPADTRTASPRSYPPDRPDIPRRTAPFHKKQACAILCTCLLYTSPHGQRYPAFPCR